ncbi:hypothetical protein ACU4GI_46885 (plasmid) [Cupriavidus basilensis]
MYEDREYSLGELAEILARGIDNESTSKWPLISLPKDAIENDGDTAADVEDPPRLQRGLRTAWGTLLVESENDGGVLAFAVSGYLLSDPYLELHHLREGGETVGIYLSDLVNHELEKSLDPRLLSYGMDWADNDSTWQVFRLIGFDEPGNPLRFDLLATTIAHWLARAGIEDLVNACQDQKYLEAVDWPSGLPISQI